MNEIDAKAKAIFFDALEQKSPQEPITFLDRMCAGDGALRSRVEELLSAHKEAGNFLGGGSPQETVTDEPLRDGPGTVIGSYKLLQQIGEGGMGTVYMAEQTHPVQRKVALKIIKQGMDSRQLIARFEAERQALAQHPQKRFSYRSVVVHDSCCKRVGPMQADGARRTSSRSTKSWTNRRGDRGLLLARAILLSFNECLERNRSDAMKLFSPNQVVEMEAPRRRLQG